MQLRGRNVGSGRLVNRPGSSFNATLAFIKRITRVCRSAVGHNSSSSTRLSKVRGFATRILLAERRFARAKYLRKNISIKEPNNGGIFQTHGEIERFTKLFVYVYAIGLCSPRAEGFVVFFFPPPLCFAVGNFISATERSVEYGCWPVDYRASSRCTFHENTSRTPLLPSRALQQATVVSPTVRESWNCSIKTVPLRISPVTRESLS